MKRLFESLFLLLVFCSVAQAKLVSDAPAPPPVAITNAWFRFLPAGLPAGGYFIIRNTGSHDLAITGAQSPACGMLMLHKSSDKGGMSGMDMVDQVPLPARGAANFTPGGFHMMCEQPKMKVGEAVPVTIQLSDGGTITGRFAVRDARGK